MRVLSLKKLATYEPLLFGTLIFVNLFVLFYFQYFPSWDGPAHVGSAAVAANYNDPLRAGFREYFFVSAIPSPNLIGHFLLTAFQKMISPLLAEKLLVLLIFSLFPLSFRYLTLVLNPDAKYISYFAFPFSIGWFVYAGQYNFSISVIVFFMAIGYWLYHHQKIKIKQVFILCLLLTILYLSHIVSFLMFFLFVFIVMGYRVLYRFFTGTETFKQGLWHLIQNSIPVIVASVPAIGMAVIYFSQTASKAAGYRYPLLALVKELGTLGSVLVVFDKREYLFTILVSLSVVALVLIALLKNISGIWKKSHNGFLVIFLFILGLYFILPDALAGGSFFSRRLCLFAYLALIFWLAHFEFQPLIKSMLVLVLTISMLGLTTVRIPRLVDFNKDIQEFMSVAPLLSANATVVTLAYTYDGYYIPEAERNGVTAFAKNIRPMDFLAGYLMAENGVVDLGNYEGAYEYFPIQYRPDVNPFVFLGREADWMEFLPPNVDISLYAEQTPGVVDYVLVWGMDVASDEFLTNSNTLLIREQLQEGYKLVYVSKPRGLMHIYEKLDR